MQLILSVILFSGSLLSAYSQVDYQEFKEHYNLFCRVPDSAVIVENQQLMDSLSSFEIGKGAKQFYYDYGWVYYMRYMKWKDIADMQKATSYWEKGWNEHQDLVALWNLGGAWRALGNCEKSLNYTELYLQNVSDTVEVDYKQIYYRYKFCRGQE